MIKVPLLSDGKGFRTRLTGTEAQAHTQLARQKRAAAARDKPYKPRPPARSGVRVWCSSTDYYTT